MGTNFVVADLRMVPHQPIVFTADPDKKPRAKASLMAFGEVRFPGSKFPFKLTTEVRITPDTLPFPASR